MEDRGERAVFRSERPSQGLGLRMGTYCWIAARKTGRGSILRRAGHQWGTGIGRQGLCLQGSCYHKQWYHLWLVSRCNIQKIRSIIVYQYSTYGRYTTQILNFDYSTIHTYTVKRYSRLQRKFAQRSSAPQTTPQNFDNGGLDSRRLTRTRVNHSTRVASRDRGKVVRKWEV
jgi:hypothetical protein